MMKVGILGCGVIGSGMAQFIDKQLTSSACLHKILDKHDDKCQTLLQTLSRPPKQATSIEDLLTDSDIIVEAVSGTNTKNILIQILKSGCDLLAMSVGQVYLAMSELQPLLKSNKQQLLIPSGAIAGIDALKASALAGVDQLTLTTRKPIKGLIESPYCQRLGIDLTTITKETTIFSGTVDEAVAAFPQNINVAATMALACPSKSFKVTIVTSPDYQTNSHHITAHSKAGVLNMTAENYPSPDNPKTSYLAVLSGIQTLKQYCERSSVGT